MPARGSVGEQDRKPMAPEAPPVGASGRWGASGPPRGGPDATGASVGDPGDGQAGLG